MSINPKMWDDTHFVSMGDKAKLLWCHLITGYSGGVPGLISGGVGAFASAMRWDIPETERAMSELSAASFIEYDRAMRLLRVPGRPKYAPCTNTNVVKGWLRRWHDLPDSSVKYRHIESIREAICERKWFTEAWSLTFGSIKIPESSRQVPLFHFDPIEPVKQNQPLSKKGNESESLETNEKQFPDSTSMSNLNLSLLPTTTTTNNKPLTINHDAYRSLANEIWSEQEEACAELRSRGAPGRALGMVNPAKLELIHRISERAAAGSLATAAEDCRHVLAVLLQEAEQKQNTRWIDGGHWESKRFNVSLAMGIGGTKNPGSGGAAQRLWERSERMREEEDQALVDGPEDATGASS